MKKVLPITFQFKYIEVEGGEKRVQQAYNRIFEIARKNIIDKRNRKFNSKK